MTRPRPTDTTSRDAIPGAHSCSAREASRARSASRETSRTAAIRQTARQQQRSLAGAARRPNLRTDRIGDITPVAKTSDVVPHLLQILKLILPRSSSVAEDSRREITIARNGDSKLDVLASAKRRMLPKRLDVENKAGMPLDGARQPTRQRLDVRVAVAGIDHERLDVTRKTHRPVH